jgi:hypothetical protein
MRVRPKPVKGELRQIRSADQDRPRGPQPCNDRRILFRKRGIPSQQRSRRRALTANVEQILDGYQHAVKGRERHIQASPLIGSIGRSPRPLARYMKEGRIPFPRGIIDPFECRFETVSDRGSAAHVISFKIPP